MNCGAQARLQYERCLDEFGRDRREVWGQIEDTLGDPGIGRVHRLCFKRGSAAEQGVRHATH